MRAAIFTEGSSTTNDSAELYSEFFKGSFLSAKALAEDVSAYCDTEIYILSETHGYVRGEEKVDPTLSFDSDNSTDHFQKALLSQIGDLDIVVLLLTTNVFDEILTPNWEQIIERTKPQSIWCIGTSRSALNSIDLESLKSKHPVFVYQRRGVARIGTEVREELMDQIRTKLNE